MDMLPKPVFRNVQFGLSILLAVISFLWALDLMVGSLQVIGAETVEKVISVTSNPFISLFIGIFITAVIQSSSTSTSMIVAIVASGNLALENAVPMVMGANIGTTLTSTLVSLSYITNNKQFKNSLTCGVMHDFFNIITVIILFPLEYYYNVLTKMSTFSAHLIAHSAADHIDKQYSTSIKIFDGFNDFIINSIEYKSLLILGSCALLLASIKIMSKLISKRLMGAAQTQFQDVFFRNPWHSFGLGTLFTSLIQSSSITTTIIVPLGATGKITLRNIFPYIVGANLGTTITALIAAMYKSEAALSIALAHFLFNLLGSFIFLIIPYLKNLPILYARRFATMITEYKLLGFVYVVVTFFILPLALIFVNRLINGGL